MQKGDHVMSKVKKVLYILLLVFFTFPINSQLFASTLSKQLNSFVFVILRHVRNENDNLLWKRCYNSIREFYLDTPIIIIDDNSRIHIPDEGIANTIVIRSEYPGAGELLPYYYFHKYRWSNKMIFLHDSMILKRAFRDSELDNSVKFHWHFETHIYDNTSRINNLLLNLCHGDLLVNYNNENKNSWNGCFGVASMIDLTILDHIQNKYLFLDLLIDKIKCREDRMALERIFAILLFKELLINKGSCSNFGDIFNYSGNTSTYQGAILKTWHGR